MGIGRRGLLVFAAGVSLLVAGAAAAEKPSAKPTPDKAWEEFKAGEHGSSAEQAGAHAGRRVGGAVQDTGKAMQSAADATTEVEAEAAGRTAAQWLKHAGRALSGFFHGFGEGMSRKSE